MKISVSAKHGQLSESVQQTIRQKVQKLPRFFDRTTGIDVIVDLEHEDTPTVEVKVSAEETDDFFAADRSSNVIAALDSVLHKLERQLRKHKEKLTDHRNKAQKHVDLTTDEMSP